MVGVIWLGAIALALASAVLVSIVAVMYYRMLRFGISKITLGHFVFSVLMLMQSLVALVSYVNLASRFGPEVGLPAMFISLMGVLAVGFLVWATLQ